MDGQSGGPYKRRRKDPLPTGPRSSYAVGCRVGTAAHGVSAGWGRCLCASWLAAKSVSGAGVRGPGQLGGGLHRNPHRDFRGASP